MPRVQDKTPGFNLITNRTNAVGNPLANKAPTEQLRCIMFVPNDLLFLRSNQENSANSKRKTEDSANSEEAIYSREQSLRSEILILLPSHGMQHINLMSRDLFRYSSKSDR